MTPVSLDEDIPLCGCPLEVRPSAWLYRRTQSLRPSSLAAFHPLRRATNERHAASWVLESVAGNAPLLLPHPTGLSCLSRSCSPGTAAAGQKGPLSQWVSSRWWRSMCARRGNNGPPGKTERPGVFEKPPDRPNRSIECGSAKTAAPNAARPFRREPPKGICRVCFT